MKLEELAKRVPGVKRADAAADADATAEEVR
jgi:hypothetical protein